MALAVARNALNHVLSIRTARGAGKRAAGHPLTPSGCEASSLRSHFEASTYRVSFTVPLYHYYHTLV